VDMQRPAGDRKARAGHVSERRADDQALRRPGARQSQPAARRPVLHGARQLAPRRRRVSLDRRLPALPLRRLHQAAAAHSGT
jgi:hypothetical protein